MEKAGEDVAASSNSSNDIGDKNRRQPCRPRRQLEYIIPAGRGDDEGWRCPACHAHYEDPVSLSCGDAVCRACATLLDQACPLCSEQLKPMPELIPSRMARRQARQMQCHCPNCGLGCTAIIGVLDVEHHLEAEGEWGEEECEQCHQQVRRAEMARHKDTTCARKPMACWYAAVGCPTSCPQCDLAAHERDGMASHMGLLRQCLAGTSLELAQTRHELSQSRVAQGGTVAALSQTQHDAQAQAQLAELARAKEQTQHDLAAIRSQIDQGLTAHWEGSTGDVALDWRPVPWAAPAAPAGPGAPPPPGPPVRYRVQATLMDPGRDPRSGLTTIVYTGPECHCRYRFPPDARVEARFVVVAMRGLTEGGPSAPARCAGPHPALAKPGRPENITAFGRAGVVAPLVSMLVANPNLPTSHPDASQNLLGVIGPLATMNPENRAAFRRAGVAAPLVRLLTAHPNLPAGPGVMELLLAIRNLTMDPETVPFGDGVVAPLVGLLAASDPNLPATDCTLAEVLLVSIAHLALDPRHRAAFGLAGVTPPLVRMLVAARPNLPTSSPDAVEPLLMAIRNLSANPANAESLVGAGVATPLVGLLSAHPDLPAASPDVAEGLLGAIANLAMFWDHGAAFGRAGAAAPLVRLLTAHPKLATARPEVAEVLLLAIYHLAEDDKASFVRAGVVAPLVRLLPQLPLLTPDVATAARSCMERFLGFRVQTVRVGDAQSTFD
ncbi:hypothetical protein PAPYR_4517 [Paratrimastix pyriformis]|uniref:RING-type domain-containing protein n=1 Tax=Paratrimastix pyriformis TaxID=342808 RepID=A0ABQ8UQ49_9EUKA|nr:hypothetical protein PAPYR_4517 [Paratrimastix pyriformis]